MSTLENIKYTDSQLQKALATLASSAKEGSTWREECGHFYGFDKENDGSVHGAKSSPFEANHRLSMLQKITACRVLDYDASIVSFSV